MRDDNSFLSFITLLTDRFAIILHFSISFIANSLLVLFHFYFPYFSKASFTNYIMKLEVIFGYRYNIISFIFCFEISVPHFEHNSIIINFNSNTRNKLIKISDVFNLGFFFVLLLVELADSNLWYLLALSVLIRPRVVPLIAARESSW